MSSTIARLHPFDLPIEEEQILQMSYEKNTVALYLFLCHMICMDHCCFDSSADYEHNTFRETINGPYEPELVYVSENVNPFESIKGNSLS